MADKIKPRRALSDEQIVGAVRKVLLDAEDSDGNQERRSQALKLYHREPFPGDETIAKGRSRYQTSDVYDQVEMHSSQQLALFEGQDDMVSFEPMGPEDELLAQQMSDITNWVLRKDNEPVVYLTELFKNAFTYGTAFSVCEFYKETKFKPAVVRKGVPLSSLVQMEQDPLQEVMAVDGPYQADSDMGTPLELHDVKVAQGSEKAGVNILSLAPEDVILSADRRFSAKTGGIDAALQGYRVKMPRRRLIELGHDVALVNSIPLAEKEQDALSELRNRHNDDFNDGANDVEPDVVVYELFLHLDVDGRDVAPLWHLTLGGDSGGEQILLAKEEVEMSPLCAYAPVLQPNALDGVGIADMIGRDQKFKSLMYRGMQDNMHQQLYPRPMVRVDGVDMDDLLNDELGAPIRVEDQTAIGYNPTPFVGPQVMMGVERLNQDIETRTGTGVNTLALNPEDLKKTTATPATQRNTNSQMRVEMYARTFAGTYLRYMFRVIRSLIANHPEEATLIMQRLRNRAIPLAPDQWDTDMDVYANVSFGNTDKPQKTNTLMQINALQKESMAAGLPLVEPQHLYNCVSEIISLNGFKNINRFMNDPSKLQPQEPQAEKPDPEMIKMQAEMQMKMEIRKMELAQEMQIAQMKLAMDREVKMHEASLKYEVAQKEMGAEIYLEGARMDAGATTKTNIANPTK